MDKISKMSNFLKYIFWFLLVLIPIGELFYWMFYNEFNDFVLLQNGPAELLFDSEFDSVGIAGRMLGLAVSIPQVVLEIFGVWQMVKLFTLYSDGKIFTAANSLCYKRAAWAFLISELLSPFVQAGISFAITMHHEVGERMISIGFDDDNLRNLLVACVILAISWVMDEGRKLNDEVELTV